MDKFNLNRCRINRLHERRKSLRAHPWKPKPLEEIVKGKSLELACPDPADTVSALKDRKYPRCFYEKVKCQAAVAAPGLELAPSLHMLPFALFVGPANRPRCTIKSIRASAAI